MRTVFAIIAFSVAAFGCCGAHAAVGAADAGHLVLSYTVPVKATPAQAYAATTDIAHWWSPDHTYSGKAANLHLDAKPGGCWCETLAGGGVEHMRVVLAMPGKLLRLAGGLGPLQSGALDGTLTFEFKTGADGNAIAVSYLVAGYIDGGLDKIAAGVDKVLGDQLQRLQQFADAGAPAAKAK